MTSRRGRRRRIGSPACRFYSGGGTSGADEQPGNNGFVPRSDSEPLRRSWDWEPFSVFQGGTSAALTCLLN